MDVVFMVVGMLGATFSIFILAVNLIFKQGLSKKVSGLILFCSMVMIIAGITLRTPAANNNSVNQADLTNMPQTNLTNMTQPNRPIEEVRDDQTNNLSQPAPTIEEVDDRKELTEAEKREAEGYYNEALKKFTKPAEAITLVEKAIAINPDNVEFLSLKVMLLNMEGRNRECIALGEDILKKYPDLAAKDKQNIYSDLLSAYEETKDYENALLYCNKAIEISADDKRTASYYGIKGNIYHNLYQYNNALECYKNSEDMGANSQIYAAMSDFYEVLGDPEAMLRYEPLLKELEGAHQKLGLNPGLAEEIDKELLMLKEAMANNQQHVRYNFPAIHTAFVQLGTLNIYHDLVNWVND
ncbi:MAG: tetratricopeptide repeat protein [Bacillota bacterium]|jgi:tetratricopeptide (TPR) repeat protein